MSNHTAAEIKTRLLQNLEGTLRHLLPNGALHGHEYCVGSTNGEAGTSLKVEMRGDKAGVWNDFSDPSNQTSGDILELWCAVRGQTFKEAFPEISRWAGFTVIDRPLVDRKPKPKPYDRSSMGSLTGTPELKYLHERGFADETLKLYRVRSHRRPSEFNEHFIAFQFIDTEGTPVMLKSTGLKPKTIQGKDRPKNVKDIWTTEPYYTLWGWWLVGPDCREIMIAEGECYSDDTEVFTPKGWIAFRNLIGMERVLQVDAQGHASFVYPEGRIIKRYKGELLNWSSPQVDFAVTPGHKMIVIDGKRQKELPAASLHRQYGIFKTCELDGPGIPLSDSQLRFCVAISADSKIDVRKNTGPRKGATDRAFHFGLKKQRKIDRLRALLTELNITSTDNKSKDQEPNRWFTGALPAWVPGRFFPQEWLELATLRQRTLILDELVHWDGNHVLNRNQTEYSSKYISNAAWVQALAHTTGISATIIPRQNQFGRWYKVSLLHSKTTASVHPTQMRTMPYDGFVHCVTVPNGRLLVRRNNKIAVCGNCDAMSVHQLAPGMPVLSMPAGTSNLEWIDNDWDRLQMMERIWVCSDCDALNRAGKRPGEEAARTIALRLGQTRVARIPLPAANERQLQELKYQGVISDMGDCWRFKDANGALLHAEPEQLEISRWFDECYYFEPQTIRSALEFATSSYSYLKHRRKVEDQNDFIWPNVRFQYRPGELTIISGYPFGGKTTFISQSHLHEASRGEKVLLVSYEMHPNATNSELAIMLWGRMPESDEEYARSMYWLDGKFWYLRPPEKYSFDEMMNDIAYAVQRHGITRVVIDSLFFLAPKEDWEGQDSVVRRLKNFTDAYPHVHVGLVAHSAVKRDHKIVPGMSDVEGSGGLVKPIDNGITIHRNMAKSDALRKAEEEENEDAKKKAEAMPDGTLYVWKQRLTGRVLYQKLYFLSDAKSFKTRKGDELLPILTDEPEPQPGENLF